MTTERTELVEPLPVEDEAATIAKLATSEEREGEWSVTPEEVEQRADALWAGDTRRALYGMAAAAHRLRAAIAADAAYVRMIAEEVDRRNESKLAQAAWLEEQVTEHAEELLPTGQRAGKFVDLPGVCRVQYVDRKRTVRIADAEAFMGWVKAQGHVDLIETRVHLRTNAAKEEAMSVLETSGELLPGVEDVPEHRTASIKWEGVA